MKPYQKDSQESYTLGVFPTLELLNHQLPLVKRVILSSKSDKNAGVTKIKEICEKNCYVL